MASVEYDNMRLERKYLLWTVRMDCYTVLLLRALEVRLFKVGKNFYGQFFPLELKKAEIRTGFNC